MERLSTIVVQKILDGFFLSLDAVDAARRKVDQLLGRPEEAPFEVQWPEPVNPDKSASAPDDAAKNKKTASEAKDEVLKKAAPYKPKKPAPKVSKKAKASNKSAKKVTKKASKKTQGKTSPRHPKVTLEIEDLTQKVKKGSIKARPLGNDDELGGKKMIARIVFVLGVAEAENLGALSSTEIAHVLTFAQGIETFGTNISRAIRQGTAEMVEIVPSTGRIQRYGLNEKGKSQFKATFVQ